MPLGAHYISDTPSEKVKDKDIPLYLMLSCEANKEMTEKSIDTVRHLIIELKSCMKRQLGLTTYKK